MRLLMSADVHGKRPVYDWLLTVARDHHVDAIVLAGDLLGCPDGFDTPEEAQQHEAAMVTELLGGAGAPVFYIMGNDDLVELNSGADGVQSIHGRQVRWGRFTFVGYQYSLPLMGGTFEKSEADIQTDLACLPAVLDAGTIFVSHSPAFGLLDPPGFLDSGHPQIEAVFSQIGSRSLRDFLATNSFLAHIHGHNHAGFGRDGKHFNVASGGQARAMLLDLETMRHQVLGVG